MNNYALKMVNERSSISLKIHDLIKMPEDEFHNYQKMSLYEQGKYYHKTQRGILRVSKYEFYSSYENRNALLKKHNIEIVRDNNKYDYKESNTPDEKVWYMHFSGLYAFIDRDTNSYGMEDIQIMNMPLLYKTSRFIFLDPYSNITPSTYYKDSSYTFPTPLLYENVPQWYDIKNTDQLEQNKPILVDKYNNIISMQAPFGLKDKYSKENILFLCKTLFAGFGGIIAQGKKSKVTNIELHTGNWGCGTLNNNKELMYLSQMIVASLMGIKKIVFHGVSNIEYENAIKKYNSLEDSFSFEELVMYLLTQGYSIEKK